MVVIFYTVKKIIFHIIIIQKHQIRYLLDLFVKNFNLNHNDLSYYNYVLIKVIIINC